MPTPKEKCAGPIYFGDQGIEVCDTCGGCICCDFIHLDHEDAERECFRDNDGRCALRAHAGRPCTEKRNEEEKVLGRET